MQSLSLDLPAMYGDHHVLAVRRLLLELPGVENVYASSCFHVVEVTYDPAQLSPEGIKSRLDQEGYLDDLKMPSETGVAADSQDNNRYFRHTSAYQQTNQVISFSQNVPYSGRPLWSCPGVGVLKTSNGGEKNG